MLCCTVILPLTNASIWCLIQFKTNCTVTFKQQHHLMFQHSKVMSWSLYKKTALYEIKNILTESLTINFLSLFIIKELNIKHFFLV